MSTSTVPPDDARLDALRQEFEHEASFSQVFVVLTVGATLIATLGLLANSTGVVIGAMVVAPWILPLQAMAFKILRGRLPMFLRALRTLMLGVVICVLLAMAVGHLVALPSFGSEVMARTSPNLLDLGVALVAGAVAALGVLERAYRGRLFHSRLGLTSVALTALLVIPLGSSFFRLLNRSQQETKAQQVEATIEQRLRSSTITLGGDPAIDLVGISIDWQKNPPLIRARVRVTDPELPTPKRVAAVDLIGPDTAPNPPALEVLPPPPIPPLPQEEAKEP